MYMYNYMHIWRAARNVKTTPTNNYAFQGELTDISATTTPLPTTRSKVGRSEVFRAGTVPSNYAGNTNKSHKKECELGTCAFMLHVHLWEFDTKTQ